MVAACSGSPQQCSTFSSSEVRRVVVREKRGRKRVREKRGRKRVKLLLSVFQSPRETDLVTKGN